jgi:hypothetical protein
MDVMIHKVVGAYAPSCAVDNKWDGTWQKGRDFYDYLQILNYFFYRVNSKENIDDMILQLILLTIQ